LQLFVKTVPPKPRIPVLSNRKNLRQQRKNEQHPTGTNNEH